jgi:hypothetical protein
MHAPQPLAIEETPNIFHKRGLIIAILWHVRPAMPAAGDRKYPKILGQVLPKVMIDPGRVTGPRQKNYGIASSTKV